MYENLLHFTQQVQIDLITELLATSLQFSFVKYMREKILISQALVNEKCTAHCIMLLVSMILHTVVIDAIWSV